MRYLSFLPQKSVRLLCACAIARTKCSNTLAYGQWCSMWWWSFIVFISVSFMALSVWFMCNGPHTMDTKIHFQCLSRMRQLYNPWFARNAKFYTRTNGGQWTISCEIVLLPTLQARASPQSDLCSLIYTRLGYHFWCSAVTSLLAQCYRRPKSVIVQ